MEQSRVRRLNSLIQQRLGNIIRQEVQSQAKTVISITRVDTAPDLSNAKIYVSILGKKDRDEIHSFDLLKQKAKYLRFLLSQDITIRHTPELLFKRDDSIASAGHVVDLINQIGQDD